MRQISRNHSTHSPTALEIVLDNSKSRRSWYSPTIRELKLTKDGFSLANAEMRLILAKLIWSFDMELQDESLNWSNHPSFLLWRRPRLMVKLRRAGTEV